MKTIATWIFDNYFLTQTYIFIISFIKEIKGIDIKIRLIYCSKLNDDYELVFGSSYYNLLNCPQFNNGVLAFYNCINLG